ncbi:MAG: hypothetical protein WD971_10160, partial [Pirellulales bacterium]
MNFKRHYGRPHDRRLRFEALEGRQMLSVTLDLGSSVAPSPRLDTAGLPDYVNVSNQPTAYQSEMMLDVNPTNPLNIVGVSHRFTDIPSTNSRVLDVFHSHDGGSTWHVKSIDYALDGQVTGSIAPFPGIRYDPAVAFDSLGNLYVAYSWNAQVVPDSRLIVARSFDGGETFQTDDFRAVDQLTGGSGNAFHTARMATGI